MYNLRGADGTLLKKPWRIHSNSPTFQRKFGRVQCVGGREHGECQSGNAGASAYYPPTMYRSITRLWRDEDKESCRGKCDDPQEPAWALWQELRVDDEERHLMMTEHEKDLFVSSTEDIDPHRPTMEEGWQVVDARLQRLRRGAGHCRTQNLARVLRDAGKPIWLVQRALRHKCPICKQIRPGGQMLPRTSVSEIP